MTRAAAHGYPIMLSDLSLEYPPRGASAAAVALRGVSLRVAPGEVLGLLGSAGSGKSTLARVLSGDFLDPDSPSPRPVITGGEAVVEGTSLRRLRRRRLAEYTFSVGYLEQEAASKLPADRTVAEIVAEPILRRDRKFPERQLAGLVATTVDAVSLPLRFLNAYPYELSGGQRQRVALARSIVLGPKLLIADEPMAGIDLTVRDSVATLINDMRKQLTFSGIVICHDLPVLRRIADRIAVLDQGRLVAIGTMDEVLGDPRHPFVAKLAGALDRGHAITDDLERRPAT
ncbi:ATP-binding cassette domain-containing protein [Agromyces archimandritae]|uniref:ABC transporter ATP-binding protein n=1 Tax=Agromyces archimandritae TaxID=2781962 RepID=A0A975FMX4_9MICO|nr:dipeptide/oligopeptide/nickel ABC transporter ATP-binding protein [Agromyces archimandritae]QTX04844.1 ABC transporter ATP-binding protein [Agromyces archimandritae]